MLSLIGESEEISGLGLAGEGVVKVLKFARFSC